MMEECLMVYKTYHDNEIATSYLFQRSQFKILNTNKSLYPMK